MNRHESLDTTGSVESSDSTQPPSRQPFGGVSPWRWWRDQMPVTRKWRYFDHAAVAPLPQPAVDALVAFQRQASEEGDTVWPEWASRVERLRSQFAELVNAGEDEIGMMPNTTAGINLVAEGWDWQPGDSVVLPEGEFPSNLFPWLNQRERGLDVRIVPRRDGRVELDDLFAQVDGSTKMIALSWVGYASGFRVDLDGLVERAHQQGVLVFLDAIQGLGMYPLDVQETPVDFLAADGHKWLLGPEGAGMVMIRREHLPKLRCAPVGWNSVKNSHQFSGADFDLKRSASRYEGGSANMIGMAALSASLEMFLTVARHAGRSAIQDRVLHLSNHFVERLMTHGISTRGSVQRRHQSGIVTFQLPGLEPAAVREAALQQKFVVSCRGGGIRASIHGYNTEEELDEFVDLVTSLS